jgi:hypothetical protein
LATTKGDLGDLFSFLLFYSPKAFALNLVFQLVSSLVVVGSWEHLVHVHESRRHRGGSRVVRTAHALLIVACKSFFCNPFL